MGKHGITDADLDRIAAPYENGSFELEPEGEVFCGSHLYAVGARCVTVVYDAKDAHPTEKLWHHNVREPARYATT